MPDGPSGSLAILVVVLLAFGPAAAVFPTVEATRTDAEFVSILPNPTADGDAGEYLVVVFPAPTNVTGWSRADGETVVRFPNTTLSGRVVASMEPEAVLLPSSNATLVHLRGRLALANAGETVELRSPDGVVDTVAYEDAPEGKRYVRTDEGWSWRVPGRTDLSVTTARDVPATLFVLPDQPSVPTRPSRPRTSGSCWPPTPSPPNASGRHSVTRSPAASTSRCCWRASRSAGCRRASSSRGRDTRRGTTASSRRN